MVRSWPTEAERFEQRDKDYLPYFIQDGSAATFSLRLKY